MKLWNRICVLLLCSLICAVVALFSFQEPIFTFQASSVFRRDFGGVSEGAENEHWEDSEVQLRDILNDEDLKKPKNLIRLKSFLRKIRQEQRKDKQSIDLHLLENTVAGYLKKNKIHKSAETQPLNFYKSDGRVLENWQQFYNGINRFSLYEEGNAHVIDGLLQDMRTKYINKTEQKSGGTQLKLKFNLDKGGRVIFKPMRFPLEHSDTWPDHFYFSDFERFFSEIASFHLDRLLGFRRVVPVTGRLINVTSEVEELAEKALLRTFFTSPAGNRCFHGKCDYYCSTGFAVCGHPHMLQGAMISYLPPTTLLKRTNWLHPYRRSYSRINKAHWETDPHYCNESLKKDILYNTGRRLADLIDLAIFDFFLGNMDRHHYDTFKAFGNYTFIVALDNGRGFGKSSHDELSILAPLTQCCIIRISTLLRLLTFYRSKIPLSARLRSALADDSIKPVLLERHLLALDRRMVIILRTVQECIQNNGRKIEQIFVNDGF